MIRDNLKDIGETITRTARRIGRDPASIKLVAVSKTVPVDLINQAIVAGQTLFGESYLQEAAEKIPACSPSVRWHFIGHLQRNKARTAAELFDVIETVDSLKLAKALDSHAKVLHKRLSILVQVNTGREPQKSGLMPEDLGAFLRLAARETSLCICGLMTIPPFFSDPEKSRPYFRLLKELAEHTSAQKLFDNNAHVELSMGMSGDYPVAIEEGATIIRVGTALFGQRNI